MLDALAALTQTLLYVGVLCAVGAVFASATLRPRPPTAALLLRYVRIGAWLVGIATLLAVAVLVLRLGAFDGEILSTVLMSNVGAAAGLRLAGSALLLITPNDEEDGFARGMQISAAALVLASFVFSGHAAAESAWLGATIALHVGLAGWWLAALLAMRHACLRSQPDAPALVQTFSSRAVAVIAALIIAGALVILGLIDLAEFQVTPYVRNLAIKLGIVAVVFALASYNKFALTSRVLANDADAIAKLKRSIDMELVLIAFVLIATAIMTTYSSPHAGNGQWTMDNGQQREESFP